MGGAGLSGHPIAILAGSGIAAAIPQVAESLNNSGAHGLSELLYAPTPRQGPTTAPPLRALTPIRSF